MGLKNGFLPDTDKGLLTWAQNFSTRITASPTTLGLTSALCTAFAGLLTTYTTCLASCDPGIRSKSTVLAKNEAKNALKANARLLANIISGQASVTDAERALLGLNVRAIPQPIPAPSEAPGVSIVGVNGRTVSVILYRAGSKNKTGKPAGVKGCSVFSYVGEVAPTDPSLYKFEGSTTRRDFEVQFPESVPDGAAVFITAFWFNPRSMSGPAALPQKARLQYGMAPTVNMKLAA